MTERPDPARPRLVSACSASELRELLADPTGEALGAITGDPLVVIDLDGADAHALRAMRHWPCVTVGVRTDTATLPVPSVSALDVLLTPQERPSRPWVHDPGGLLDRIAANVVANPQASVTLAQVLRVTEQLDPGDALVAESLAYSMLLGGPEFQRWLAHRALPRPASAPTADPVLVTRSGADLEIRLHRADVHNAYSAAVRDALVEALAVPIADPTINRIVLCGDGASFCSGGDLREFGTTPDPVTAHVVRTTRSPGRLLAQLAERVVARLHGACIGAGIELAAFAAHVHAHTDAWFQLPEVTMGLIPGAGGTVSLPRRIGRQRTAALCLSADRLGADHALDWGLVDEFAG